MKRIGVVVIVLVMASATGFAQSIVGTPHDTSGQAWNTTGQICVVCHTPHNAKQGADNLVPLWNHEVTASVFTLYSSPTGTLDATLSQPDGVSKACLSCHDGTVGLEAFGGVTTNNNLIGGSANLGTDLSNDHPVSFTYNTALATADGGLHDPATQASGLGGTIAADMLFTNLMECGSCHDVHDNTNSPFLVKSNAASGLCLTCHNK